MSLLDDVRIVVTPNGYKAGELYAVIPVPTEGAEEVDCGDFSCAVPTDYWSEGTGWDTSGGSASSDGTASFSSLSQASVLTIGKRYKLIVDINLTSGQLRIQEGGVILETYTTTGANTATYYFIATATNITFKTGPSPFLGSIDNVSVKEYTSADMDVTRATAATRVDENGLVNYAEVIGDELVADGSFPTGTSEWGTGTGVTVGSGVATFTSTPSGQSVQQNAVATALPNGSLAKVSFEVLSRTEGSFGLYFSGTLVGSRSSVGVFTAYFTKGTQTSFYIRALGTTSGTISNVSVIEETRDNVPRIDYTGGGCPHILAEPQRTNVNTYSEDFSQSFYIKDSGVSVGDTNIVSPSGESNASQIDVTDNGRIYANVASDTYASSVFIKAGTFAYFKIGGVNIDLVAGTNANGTIESLGSGWFRVGINYTGNRPFQIQAYPDGTYSSHETTGDYYIWGSQIEAGSYATSYIPTSGSTVTRNQDIFTRDGIGSLINSQEGVLFVEMAALSDDGTTRALSLSDGTSSNRILIYYSSTSNQVVGLYTYGGSTQVNITNILSDSTEFIKCAFKFKENDCAFWINGVEVGTDTSSTAFSANTLNDLGFDSGAGGSDFYGKVKQLQVYESALTDDQLTSLTK